MGITPDGLFGLSESEDEFFGDSSVASFLKQIKDSATKEPERGSSTTYPIPRATSGTTSIAMPPVAENGPSVKAYDLPPRQLADYLLNLYFEKIHSLYPYVHKTSFLRAYGRLWMPLAETDAETVLSGLGLGDACVSLPLFHCALNIIFALGCHFSKLDQTAREATAEEFFQRSQRLLNMISLDKGDLALVQTLLLTSQYLQGGESPSRCWNIIGLACRIAQSLGMHSLKADRARTPAQIQMRRRVWHGCVMLDLASSMMLGRPPMTHSSAVPLPEAIDDEYLDSSMATCQPSTETLSGTEFYVRTLQLYKILRKILSEVYEPWEDERAPDQSERPKSENELAQTLLSLDEELLAFESNLPVALQWRDAQQPADVAGPFRRESSLLRGRFLHLRILLLRPTLVKFCRNGFPPRQAGGYPRYQQVLSKSRISVDFSISCSTSCVETAIELSHLMNDISTTELASVWWYNVFYAFTAGVVLILAQASPAMTSKFSQPVLENAWKSCCDCLENMNPYSNTARNCATNLRKTLSQVLDGQGQESRVLANKPVPQSTGQYLGRDTSLPRAPNYLSTLAGSEVGDDSTQGALDTQFSEALDSLWSGDDVNSSLMEMLWDDLWLTAPSFF
ncbi:activator of stress genes 1 [Aspergillus niger]|nr:activator of stress genes 1 [Aspergillus niger]